MTRPTDKIVRPVLEPHPAAQAIYIFGTYGTAYEREDSDVDIAVLLHPQQAKAAGFLALGDFWFRSCARKECI